MIDLISLKPFDMATISNSVKKTKRVIIVEECMKTGGIGASLSSVINESLFDYLDHQVCAGLTRAGTSWGSMPAHWRVTPHSSPTDCPLPWISQNLFCTVTNCCPLC